MPFYLKSFDFLEPIYSTRNILLAPQTGTSHTDTFWIVEWVRTPHEILQFKQINSRGTLLQMVYIDGDYVHSVLGEGIDLAFGREFGKGAFQFAVLESGIIINYFAHDVDFQLSTVVGLLTLEGQLQKIDPPPLQFVFLVFHDSYDNGLYAWAWQNDELCRNYLFRLDGATLTWTRLVASDT